MTDATSGKDLTKIILAQIILEEEKGNRNLLPVEFLHEIIKYGESTYGDFLKGFLASGFEAYQQAQQQMDCARLDDSCATTGMAGSPARRDR